MSKREAKRNVPPGKQADTLRPAASSKGTRELWSAAGRFLDRMVEYASAVAAELRRCASPPIRPDRQLLQVNCQALEWQLRTVGVSTDGKALTDGKVLNLDALEGYGVPAVALLSCFATTHRSRGRPAMKSLADLATETLNTVVEKGSRPTKELVDCWDRATAELADVARSLSAEGGQAGAGKGEAEDLRPTSCLTSLRVIDRGHVYDGWEALRAILRTAGEKVLIEDAYIDADGVALITSVSEGVCVRILTRRPCNDAEVAFRKLSQQRSGMLEMRTTRDIHGRRIYVDGRVWILEDSIKDLASKTASSIVPVNDPETQRLTEDFERRWATAGVRIRPKA